jgi:hypothetical protein
MVTDHSPSTARSNMTQMTVPLIIGVTRARNGRLPTERHLRHAVRFGRAGVRWKPCAVRPPLT